MKILASHALALVALTAQAQAASYIYEFDQDNYGVLPGQTVDVKVFLTQNDPNPIDLTVDGLFSGGVRVIFGDNAPSDPAVVTSLSDITPNPAFDDTLLGEELFLEPGQSAALIDGVDDISAPLTGTSILLGTFRFTAGDIPSEVTNLRADDVRPDPFTDTLAGDFPTLTSLDESISPGFATITVIPAPTAAAAGAAGMISLCLFTRRRLNRTHAESDP